MHLYVPEWSEILRERMKTKGKFSFLFFYVFSYAVIHSLSVHNNWYNKFVYLKADLEKLYKENSRVLLTMAMCYVHNKEVAEDIVHDSWIIIFTNLDSLKSEDKLLPWMKGIVKNLSLKYLDSKKRHPTTDITENQEIISNDESESILPFVPFDELISMIGTLPEKYGEVFRLSVLNGMSHKEIGKLMGIAPHSSSSNLSRARKILEQKVKKYLLLTLALLLPVSALVFLHKSNRPVTGNEPTLAEEQQAQIREPSTSVDEQSAHIPDKVNTIKECISRENTAATVDKIALPWIEMPAEIKPGTALLSQTEGIALRDIYAHPEDPAEIQVVHRPSGIHLPGRWTALLGLSGVTGLSSVSLANTISLADYSGTGEYSRNLIFNNWSDYSKYVLTHNRYLNETESKAFMEELSNNMRGKSAGVEETQRHFRPLTVRVLAEKCLDDRWALESGLGITYLKSEFENSYLGYLGDREQRLFYLGIPLGLKYTAFSLDRLSLYVSFGGELDIPVYGRQTVVGAAPTDIRGSFMGALETSAGVQYGITHNLNAYIEVGVRYNITGTPAFHTYYSAHPIMVSTPFGLRLQF